MIEKVSWSSLSIEEKDTLVDLLLRKLDLVVVRSTQYDIPHDWRTKSTSWLELLSQEEYSKTIDPE